MAKNVNYSSEEEEQLEFSFKDFYGHYLDTFLDGCFEKIEKISVTVSLLSKRTVVKPADLFTYEKWNNTHMREMQSLKRKLNSVKEKLNTYDLNEWHTHTRAMNPADLVMRRLRSDLKVEFLTQAWCKFYEIVHRFNLIPRSSKLDDNTLYTIHLCEAPGAFVASLNHYLKLNFREIRWCWMANSLNPYYEGNHLSEMINDDRFMLQTIRRWDFGPDMTGDITHPNYPDYLLKKCNEHLPHLVTADGSFDCQDRPEEQESSVAWLHLKETLMALRILRKGGHFVLKMFTFFECDTICLLYLLSCSFMSVDIFKPATSKEGNSEVYVVCREFKRDQSLKPFLDRLLKVDETDHSKYAMFPYEYIPRTFLKCIHDIAETFANIQMSIIERNILTFPHTKNPEIKRVRQYLQEKLFERYRNTYNLKPISLNDTVVRMPYRRNGPQYKPTKVLEHKEHKQGSHADQVKRSSMATKELLKKIMEEIPKSSFMDLHNECIRMPRTNDLSLNEFSIRTGKPIKTICSSQFCYGTYIRVRNELISATGLMKYNIMAADVERIDSTKGSPHEMCDFTNIFMYNEDYNEAQLICFRTLYDRLTTLTENENLILISFPLLTQFNVSLLYVMTQFFREVTFVPPSVLYLNNVHELRKNTWLKNLSILRERYNNENAVISFLPIDSITGSDNKFYSWVIKVNDVRVLYELQKCLYFIPISS